MMKSEKVAIANIYVPVKRRETLKPEIVQEIAQSMLKVGQTTPIRQGPSRPPQKRGRERRRQQARRKISFSSSVSSSSIVEGHAGSIAKEKPRRSGAKGVGRRGDDVAARKR